jgi:hypothetical protein
VAIPSHLNTPKFNECGTNYLKAKRTAECVFLFKFFLFLLNRFNLAEKEGEADRKVPLQPLVFVGKDGKVSRYNLRKVTQIIKR